MSDYDRAKLFFFMHFLAGLCVAMLSIPLSDYLGFEGPNGPTTLSKITLAVGITVFALLSYRGLRGAKRIERGDDNRLSE